MLCCACILVIRRILKDFNLANIEIVLAVIENFGFYLYNFILWFHYFCYTFSSSTTTHILLIDPGTYLFKLFYYLYKRVFKLS